jgi:hypothetical protein
LPALAAAEGLSSSAAARDQEPPNGGAEGGGEDDGDEGSDDDGDDDDDDDDDDSDGDGGGNGGGGDGRDGDPARDGSANPAPEAPKPHDPVVSDEHPLGDYGGALFDYAKAIADDLAAKYKEAAPLKDLFDEAAHAREVWSALKSDQPITTDLHLTGLLSDETSTHSYLIEDYQRAGLFAAYFGMSTTSTTGGSHNPASAHYQHKAVDINVQSVSRAELEKFMFLARSAGLYVRDERGQPILASGRPQEPWSNPHVHVQTSEPPRGVPFERFSSPPLVPGSFMNFRKR